MVCTPPFHPCPGHESKTEHDAAAQCLFYAVFIGYVRGAYTNSWIARGQTDGYTDSRQKAFKKWADLEHWWSGMCAMHHTAGCPPFESVGFSLNPPSNTHPSSPPCTRAGGPIPRGHVILPNLPLLPAYTPVAGPSTAVAGPSTAVAGPSTTSLPVPAPSPFTAPPHKKEEPRSPKLLSPPRVTLNTRVQLTPTGLPRGLHLAAATAAAQSGSRTPRASAPPMTLLAAELATDDEDDEDYSDLESTLTESSTLSTAPSSRLSSPELRLATPVYVAAPVAAPAAVPAPVPAAPILRAAPVIPSVLVTPGPGAPSTPEPARHLPRVRQYGIRGVSVFYPTHESARAAAMSLGIDPKIMVSDNVEKLEAWMIGETFLGEDS
ncbi:hypothetical protein B0H16DRAFT_1458852 [Mycena metata]|uniref:Uncharacterized protein n=1 Tax=Mycena metata TaxID=1033252 RepID=A0AAD7NCS0_9AGAR|nr:hypothetical protein B0H16DRAFT_1458852 [Mycena metata]